jgi:hypothetical protein
MVKSIPNSSIPSKVHVIHTLYEQDGYMHLQTGPPEEYVCRTYQHLQECDLAGTFASTETVSQTELYKKQTPSTANPTIYSNNVLAVERETHFKWNVCKKNCLLLCC